MAEGRSTLSIRFHTFADPRAIANGFNDPCDFFPCFAIPEVAYADLMRRPVWRVTRGGAAQISGLSWHLFRQLPSWWAPEKGFI